MTLNLHEKALTCAKNYKRCELELLNILTQIDQDKTYLAFGVSSLFRYCVELLKLSEADAAKFIQVVRKAAVVPELKTAIEMGEITTTKAARIAAVITQENHQTWIQTAKNSTHRELEREVASVQPKALTKERIKVLTPEYSELKLNISKELESKLRRAQEVLRTGNLEQTLENLVELALNYKDPVRKAERVQNKQTAVQHRTCDVRPKRYIPAAIRHQVFLRDQGKCTFKNCNETRNTEVHHKILISRGGRHTLENMTTLCYAHHSMMHPWTKQRR